MESQPAVSVRAAARYGTRSSRSQTGILAVVRWLPSRPHCPPTAPPVLPALLHGIPASGAAVLCIVRCAVYMQRCTVQLQRAQWIELRTQPSRLSSRRDIQPPRAYYRVLHLLKAATPLHSTPLHSFTHTYCCTCSAHAMKMSTRIRTRVSLPLLALVLCMLLGSALAVPLRRAAHSGSLGAGSDSDSNTDADIDVDIETETAADSDSEALTVVDQELESVEAVSSGAAVDSEQQQHSDSSLTALEAEFSQYVTRMRKTYGPKSKAWEDRRKFYTANRNMIVAHNAKIKQQSSGSKGVSTYGSSFTLKLGPFADLNRQLYSLHKGGAVKKHHRAQQRKKQKQQIGSGKIRKVDPLRSSAYKQAKAVLLETEAAEHVAEMTEITTAIAGEANSESLMGSLSEMEVKGDQTIDWSKYDQLSYATTNNPKGQVCVTDVQYQVSGISH